MYDYVSCDIFVLVLNNIRGKCKNVTAFIISYLSRKTSRFFNKFTKNDYMF